MHTVTLAVMSRPLVHGCAMDKKACFLSSKVQFLPSRWCCCRSKVLCAWSSFSEENAFQPLAGASVNPDENGGPYCSTAVKCLALNPGVHGIHLGCFTLGVGVHGVRGQSGRLRPLHWPRGMVVVERISTRSNVFKQVHAACQHGPC